MKAVGFERTFVSDAVCRDDVLRLGGQPLLGRYESWQRFSHRADLWRYIRMHEAGGSYIDIKMALLRPLTATLADIYAEGNGSPYAVSSPTFCHADSGACMSYGTG